MRSFYKLINLTAAKRLLIPEGLIRSTIKENKCDKHLISEMM